MLNATDDKFSGTLVITPLPHRLEGESIVRSCRVRRVDAKSSGQESDDERELWFRFDARFEAPAYDDCDSYLLAVLFDAMHEERKIIVEGSVSRGLLANLVELQAVWHKWRWRWYQEVPIEVAHPREAANENMRAAGAVCAFSGGVDATFSVWRHTQKLNSWRSQAINLCVLVQGFDIPLDAHDEYANAFHVARETLRDVNVELTSIATNLRAISNCGWNELFGIALAATLSNLKRVAGTGLIGSSMAYDFLRLPYGSSPVGDHLMSSDEFRIMHDGASHWRPQKVREIANWPVGVRNLRVCWQGEYSDRNCGECEKCVRTMCNFLANGLPIPECFPQRHVDAAKLKALGIRKVRRDWTQNLKMAKLNGIDADWTRAGKRLLYGRSLVEMLLLQPRREPPSLLTYR